ncbi:two-component regulator propeller domain-containing protein [Algoriphagus sp. C2-6-M1]|uniref:two-component regulator propeller domain-containing protein n=1 Tax=Algoriphagus persicinus TaxID=3108754 RepID=UPI002B3C0CB7|nr:two-component regulator propeller domain-containing protein [Algoriphagus sp. C2-6-M1]MEB2779760.1 two-component regulator propeller domain-containing protein [Algoriphagus sp. C2-6-M1]
MTNIVGMCQDEMGFIWLADNYNGLIRYDGTNKVNFKSNPNDSNSLFTNRLETVISGNDGVIWIGSFEEGLDRFDLATETFTHFHHDPADPSSLSSNSITSLLEDKSGTLWVGTISGLDTLNRATGTFVSIVDQSAAGQLLSKAAIRTIYEDQEGIIWVGCGNFFGDNPKSPNDGLIQINIKSGEINHFVHNPKDPTSLIDNRIRAIFEDSHGNFWVGSAGDGLHLMDRATGSFRRFEYDPANPERLSRPPVNLQAEFAVDHITFINEDVEGFLWIGTYAGGINRYNPENQRVEFFGKSTNPAYNLDKNDFWTMLKTEDNLLWLAGWEPKTENQVLYQLATFPNQLDYITLNRRPITFEEDLEEGVWIGTERGLVGYQLNGKNESFFAFVQNRIGENYITDLSFDSPDYLWVATLRGLYHFDRLSRSVVHYLPDERNSNSLSSNAVVKVYPDLLGKVWIGTAEGLDVLNTQTGQFTHFIHVAIDSNSLVSNVITAIHKDTNGNMWIGTDKGLSFYDQSIGIFQSKLIQNSAAVNNIFEDSRKRLWVSAYRSGLFFSDDQGKSFSLYSDSTGLITDGIFVKGIVEDQNGLIWLNTDIGFIQLNTDTGNAVLFGNSWKKTKENSYNSLQTYISSRREIFAGDPNGFYHFSTLDLQKDYLDAPRIYWRKFFLGNREVIPRNNKFLPLPLSQTEKITLPYHQNSFAFEVGDIDFVTAQNEKNILYKLEDYDWKWGKVNSNNMIIYYNLPPGDYVLRVKSANRFGVLGEKAISIQILQPWYFHWWALILFTLLFVAILYTIYDFLLDRKLEQAEVNRLQELNLVKSRFYTNLTHEFRTPLTVISGIADQVLENPQQWLKEGLPMIKRNSLLMQGLINQMLDLAKLDSGAMPVKMVQNNIISYITYLADSFHSFAESKDIRLHLLTNSDELIMDFDPEKTASIFSNLVGNAIKFTPIGGDVYIHIDLADSQSGEKFLNLKIRDNGKGISNATLPYIFDRFYQVDNSSRGQNEGTGIGLSLTKELVTLLGGCISVNSQEGKGTEFLVTLPVRHEAPMGIPKEWTPQTHLIEENNGVSSILPFSTSAGELPLALLIDDNEDVLKYLVSCLQSQYGIQMARNGIEGIKMAIELIPDIIISDVVMPEKNGYEVVEILKNDERTSHIPIILLTAKAGFASRLEGLERGADAYLAKPFDKKELYLRLRKLIELRQHLNKRYDKLDPIESPNSETETQEDVFLKKLRLIVETNIDDDEFGITKLCREMGISRTQMPRKLKALTAKSTSQIIRTIRMQHAKKLLQNPELHISEIGYAVGYGNPSHFTQEFSKEFGVAPSHFRKK